jgi:hypothetical protein
MQSNNRLAIILHSFYLINVRKFILNYFEKLRVFYVLILRSKKVANDTINIIISMCEFPKLKYVCKYGCCLNQTCIIRNFIDMKLYNFLKISDGSAVLRYSN